MNLQSSAPLFLCFHSLLSSGRVEAVPSLVKQKDTGVGGAGVSCSSITDKKGMLAEKSSGA